MEKAITGLNDKTPLLPTHQSGNQDSNSCCSCSYWEGKMYSVIKYSLFCTGLLSGGVATYEFLLPKISITLSPYMLGALGFTICIVTCGGGICLGYVDPYRILQRALKLLPEQTEKLKKANEDLCTKNKLLKETLAESNQEIKGLRLALDRYGQVNQESREDLGNKVGKLEEAGDTVSRTVDSGLEAVNKLNRAIQKMQGLEGKLEKAEEPSHSSSSEEEFLNEQMALRKLISDTTAVSKLPKD